MVDMKRKNVIKTSVIIPVYNTSSYIEECIDSVFNQTQKEIEVIAIDDGSTDGSLDVLLDMKKKYPSLIVITQENHCQGYARNVGMKIARGRYIYFLDSDDYILEDTLEKCYECASNNKLDVVLFDALDVEDSIARTPVEPNYDDRHEIISERDEIFTGICFLEKYCQQAYNPCTCLVYCSADFLRKNNIWFLSEVYFEDNEFHCKIMTLAQRVMYIPEMLYRCRCRDSSTTRASFDLKKAYDHIKVIDAITELKILNDGKGWKALRQISLKLLRYVAVMCKRNNLYYEDGELSEQVLKTWIKICEHNIVDIKDKADIDFIYNISMFFPDKDLREERKLINFKREQLLKQIFKQIPLKQKECKIAIYGCGKYTDKFLNLYEKWVGAIVADVIFLDSYIKDKNTKYRGCVVYHISEIREKKLDYILISSPQYEIEMNNAVQELYGNKFKAVMLYGDLHISI